MAKLFVLLAGLVGLSVLAIHFLPPNSKPGTKNDPPLTVEQLLDRGSDLDGRGVSVQGTVVSRVGFMGIGGYRMLGGRNNRQLLVLTDRGIPRLDARVVATGIFRQGLEFGLFQTGVLIPPQWCEGANSRPAIQQVVSIVCRQ